MISDIACPMCGNKSLGVENELGMLDVYCTHCGFTFDHVFDSEEEIIQALNDCCYNKIIKRAEYAISQCSSGSQEHNLACYWINYIIEPIGDQSQSVRREPV